MTFDFFLLLNSIHIKADAQLMNICNIVASSLFSVWPKVLLHMIQILL